MQDAKTELTVSVEILPLKKGIYQFSVQSAQPRRVGEDGEIILPAVHVGLGPGIPSDTLQMMTGLRNEGAWLYEQGDTIILKVAHGPAPVLLTSVRAAGAAPLDIFVERLDGKKPSPSKVPQAASAAPALPSTPALQLAERPPRPDFGGRKVLKIDVMTHIQVKGDVTFSNSYWAGAIGEKLAIEAFSVTPLEDIAASDIEYKALTASGVETPWVEGGALCGTRQQNLPLVAFAVRLKGAAAQLYDCDYRGAFRSGKIVGSVTNGAPCQSASASDFLEGIQLSLVERKQPVKSSKSQTTEAESAPADKPKIGPRFSVFREDA